MTNSRSIAEPPIRNHPNFFVFPGEKNSYVHGSIINQVFTGKIVTGKGEGFWVEHADKYFTDPDFHSIIYAEQDVHDDPHR